METKIDGIEIQYCVHCEYQKIERRNLDYLCEACDLICF